MQTATVFCVYESSIRNSSKTELHQMLHIEDFLCLIFKNLIVNESEWLQCTDENAYWYFSAFGSVWYVCKFIFCVYYGKKSVGNVS